MHSVNVCRTPHVTLLLHRSNSATVRRPFSRHALLAFLLVLGCSRAEPPTWTSPGVSDSVSPIAPGPDAGLADALDAAAPEDSGALPQTHDRPKAAGPLFESRVADLWDAIVHDDPDRAMPFFFPVAAYAQVKAIANPSSDFKHRLVANFVRDVHAAHKKLGAHALDAKFISVEVPMNQARWVEPGEEGNKIGYFRVYGSKLNLEVAGVAMTIEITSMISWRGEWYLVHLSGFK